VGLALRRLEQDLDSTERSQLLEALERELRKS
jgi:hypothetical protein